MIGKINSIETMGLVDGPGVRFVVFMQGCPLRCIFCHNPETWNLNGKAQEYTEEELIKKILNYKPYFKTSFSPGFIKWCNSNEIGTSIGNGAMMRISPIGFSFDNEHDVKENARLATIPSHNSKEAIVYSTLIALIIFYARNNMPKNEILRKLNIKLKYKPKEDFQL